MNFDRKIWNLMLAYACYFSVPHVLYIYLCVEKNCLLLVMHCKLAQSGLKQKNLNNQYSHWWMAHGSKKNTFKLLG